MAENWWNTASQYVDDFAGKMDASGRFSWAVDGANVRVYDSLEWIKLKAQAEAELKIGSTAVIMPVFAEFTLPSPCFHVKASNDGCLFSSASKIFSIALNAVFDVNDTTKSKIFNEQSPFITPPFSPEGFEEPFRFDFGVIEEIGIPESIIQSGAEILSNVHPFLGGLYMAASDLINDEVQMHIYNVADKLWSQVPVPVTKAIDAILGVIDDGEGSILITNFNDASISKFEPDGTFVSTTKVDDGNGVNTGPYAITKNDANEIEVYSANGMGSKYDTIADVIANDRNMINQMNGVVDDGTHVWGVTTNTETDPPEDQVIRIDKADNTYKTTNAPIESCGIKSGGFTNELEPTEFVDITISPKQTYDTKDGPITTDEHIIVSSKDESDNKNTSVIENPKQPNSLPGEPPNTPPDEGFWRPVNASITAIGMISSGPHDYTGN